MKIVYVTNSKINSNAANAVNIAKMCAAFSELGHEVTLIAQSTKAVTFDKEIYFEKFGIDNRFEIEIVPETKLPFLKSIAFVLRSSILIRKASYDLVFIRFWYDYILSLFIGNNVIIERHAPYDSNIILNCIQKMSYRKRNLKRIVLITGSLRKIVLEQDGFVEKKLIVLSDGATLVKHTSIDDDIPMLHGFFKQNVGYIGHLYEGRGIDIIIKLSELNPLIGFHIVGGNETDIIKWKEISQHLCNIFFYGHIPHARVGAYASNMDVLLAPYQEQVSVSNGINTAAWMSPLKIFEYMTFCRPFISSDIAVLREILIDGYNCLLCESNNVDQWNYLIRNLLTNKQLSKQLSDNAYNDVVLNYTWVKRAEKILDSLNK